MPTGSHSHAYNHYTQNTVNGRTPSYYRGLIEHVRKHAPSAAVVQERIKGKAEGKEQLFRFEGEVVGRGTESHESAKEPGVVRDEEQLVIRDPRKVPGFKKLQNLRPGRSEFHEVKYEVCFVEIFLHTFVPRFFSRMFYLSSLTKILCIPALTFILFYLL